MQDEEKPIHIPRGVGDLTGKTGFIADASGGISAIGLVNGAVLWRSAEAARPLLVFDDRLAAARTLNAHTLQIVLMDVTARGAVRLVSEPIVFPDWAVIGPQNNQGFALEAGRSDGNLLLGWEAHAYYRGGAAPSQKVMEQATRDASGTVRVDLATGRATMLPPDEGRPGLAETRSFSPLPAVEPGAQDIHQVGPRLYYLFVQPTGTGNRILLRARDMESGKLAWELPLEEKPVSRASPLRP